MQIDQPNKVKIQLTIHNDASLFRVYTALLRGHIVPISKGDLHPNEDGKTSSMDMDCYVILDSEQANE